MPRYTPLSLTFALLLHILAIASADSPSATPASQPVAIGLTGPVGPRRATIPKQTLRVDKPGVYEDLLIDAQWADTDAVHIRADQVTLRNCEIRNALRDGVEVYGSDILIENCHIHHLLAATFVNQKDAHGITGRPTRL